MLACLCLPCIVKSLCLQKPCQGVFSASARLCSKSFLPPLNGKLVRKWQKLRIETILVLYMAFPSCAPVFACMTPVLAVSLSCPVPTCTWRCSARPELGPASGRSRGLVCAAPNPRSCSCRALRGCFAHSCRGWLQASPMGKGMKEFLLVPAIPRQNRGIQRAAVSLGLWRLPASHNFEVPACPR